MRNPLALLRGGRLFVALVALVGLILLLGRVGATAWTEILWFRQVGYSDVLWKRVLWHWGTRFAGGVLVGVAVYGNLRIVSRTLGGIQIKRRFGNLEISERLPRSVVNWIILGAAAVLALWFGAAVPSPLGLQLLTLAHGGSWGLTEPILGRDVGFYVFWLPVLGNALAFTLVTVFLLFTLAVAGYAATGAVRWGRGRLTAQDLPRVHLGTLMGIFFLLLAARFWLGRYMLLLDGTSDVQGIVGFTDAEARLPALQTMAVISIMAAVAALWAARTGRGAVLISAAVTTGIATLLIPGAYPAMIQRFRVEPNELQRESPFIDANLRFTRLGFGLDSLERRALQFSPDAEIDWGSAARQFSGLPVWSTGALLPTFRSVEGRFRYYDFGDVAIDRYDTPAGPVPVAVSVREVDPVGIPDPNWQNLHLRRRYIEGMGAVASLAAARTPEGRPPMLLSGIPPVSAGPSPASPELRLERPQVFFGSRPQYHAVVNPGGEEFLAPDGSPGVMGVDFPDGIELGSWMRKAALAWRFGDANLLFAAEVQGGSRFVYRRSVLERARAVAPFLHFPEPPYPVVAEGRIVWILEGFTGTRGFPLSTPHDLQFLRSVSYLRNSVKVTVDAVTGDLAFYRVPISDPLADAYQEAFPGLFRPLSELPAALRSHVRYSRELLNLQASVLLQYHQETARAFHGQQDVWALPHELAQGTTPVPYRPEFGIWTLPSEDDARFNLTAVFVPAGRQNLTAMLVARADEAGMPRLILFDVTVDDQIPGPRQIEALVEQDPQISQQFSLWRTGGSEVWTGHLHLVPVGQRILYMEPVFLAAAADAIPELRRFVVSDGRRVVMTEDLGGALAVLAGRDLPSGTGDAPGLGSGDLAGPRAWPAAALEILNRAEDRLRQGDWQGFGVALEELKALLRSLGPESGDPGR